MERIALRTGTSAEWAVVGATEILAKGEPGYDLTTQTLKIGDGSTVWNSLPTAASWSGTATLDNVTDTATRAAVRPADALALANTNVTSYVTQGTTLAQGKVQLAEDGGTTAGTVVEANDSRLTDARTPTAHKTSHSTGGADALSPSDIGAAASGDPASAVSTHNGITLAVHGIADTSALVLTNDSRLTDNRTPSAHVSTHRKAGTDELKLSDLGEVTMGTGLSAPSNGQVLAFDGTIWENQDNPVVAHAANLTTAHGLVIANVGAKPNAVSGPGLFQQISAAIGAALALPADGSDFVYQIICLKSDGTLNLTTPFVAGIAAGETEIGAATAGHMWIGSCYKI